MNRLSLKSGFYNNRSDPKFVEFQQANLVKRIELFRQAQQPIIERASTPPSPNSVAEVGGIVKKKVKFNNLSRVTLIPHFKDYKKAKGDFGVSVHETLYHSKSELALMGSPAKLEDRLEMYNDLLDTGIGDLRRKGLENLKIHLECLVEKIEILSEANPKKEKMLQRAKDCLGNYFLIVQASKIVYAKTHAIQAEINDLTNKISILRKNKLSNIFHSAMNGGPGNNLRKQIHSMEINLTNLQRKKTEIKQGIFEMEMDYVLSSSFLQQIRQSLGPALDGIKELLTLGDLPEDVREILELGEKILKPKGILKSH